MYFISLTVYCIMPYHIFRCHFVTELLIYDIFRHPMHPIIPLLPLSHINLMFR